MLRNGSASLALCIAIVVVAATMMQPTGASLIAIVVVAALLGVMRWAAHLEGRGQSAREQPAMAKPTAGAT